jgi:hypothetical protein
MEDEDGEEEGSGTPHHHLPPEGDHGPFNSLSVSSQYMLKCPFREVGRLLRAEGFFCNVDVLYGGLGIVKL